MFDYSFLHVIRDYEFNLIKSKIGKESKILEIGGGTGYQAKCFFENGFQIESIDVENNNNKDNMIFPITTYDGEKIPFPDNYFDIVYSSNVLEHIRNLNGLSKEIQRVLKENGKSIHLMPSTSWRFWTNLAHYVELIQRLNEQIPRLIPYDFSENALRSSSNVLRLIFNIIKQYLFVPRHGEFGNSITELITFNKFFWKAILLLNKFKIQKVFPTKLFYTGHMIYGKNLSINRRIRLSRFLGSACNVFILKN